MLQYQAVIDFWFNEIEPKTWWIKDKAFDAEIRQRFGELHTAAQQGECYLWREAPLGRLAEIIVLDQFSRNIYRDQALAFACDSVALVLAQEAIAQQADQALVPSQRAFLYLPYMHSESSAIHEIAITLFAQAGMESMPGIRTQAQGDHRSLWALPTSQCHP